MKYDLTKITEKIKKITNFNILNETPDYLVVGTKVIFNEAVKVGHDNKYCFQPYSNTRKRELPVFFYVAYYDKKKNKFNAPVFWADTAKIKDLETELEEFIQEI